MDGILTTLGLKQGAMLSGLAGALVSYRFFRELKWPDRIVTAVAGLPVAIYCGPLVASGLNITSERTEMGITFLVGAIGISFLAAVVKAMPELVTAAKDYLLGKGK